MIARDPDLARTYVRYDSSANPQSLSAARTAIARLDASSMLDASLVAEAACNGFAPAAARTVDGVAWTHDVSAVDDAAMVRDWLPRMPAGTVGLEQFVHGHLRPNQADVAAAWPLTSWSPDAKNASAVADVRRACLRSLANGSLVFGLSHTASDESDLVQDASDASELLTVSEGSMNVALYASFRTDAPPSVQETPSISLQHDFVRVDASDVCVQISRTRAEMINGPRRSRIGPKLTEIRASKVEKNRKTPGFPGHRRRRRGSRSRSPRATPPSTTSRS
jgi:hypothetical protein